MNQVDLRDCRPTRSPGLIGLIGTCLIALSVVGLAACGPKEKPARSGQAMVSVNGVEITASQFNEELLRSGATAAQAQEQRVARQILENLVDRQLVVNAAMQEQVDRDPQVVRAVERAKALLVAQAYLQKKADPGVKPTPAEVNRYYEANPQFFAQRKQLELQQLVLMDDLTPELETAIAGARTLDEVTAYLGLHKIHYGRNQVTRSTADLPKELADKLLSLPKGKLLLVRESHGSVLNAVTDVRDAPVGQEVATPQIEQFLAAEKNRTAAVAEVARLRTGAKIEYLARAATLAPGTAVSAVPALAKDSDAVARGVAGLK
jgi:EpsD family peptidyl-prolyl cis-trans isomerase